MCKIKRNKKKDRKRRVTNENNTICSSCKQGGHSSARSSDCPDHDFNINELLLRDLQNYTKYTVSLTMESFKHNNDSLDLCRNKIILLSSFLRQVVFKAQTYINCFILNKSNALSDDLFDQEFWYSVCRLIFGKLTIEQLQNQYPDLRNLSESYRALTVEHEINLSVPSNDLKNYGQIVSSACITIATTYNNYHVENFEHYITNCFICCIIRNFSVSVKLYNNIYFVHIICSQLRYTNINTIII